MIFYKIIIKNITKYIIKFDVVIFLYSSFMLQYIIDFQTELKKKQL